MKRHVFFCGLIFLFTKNASAFNWSKCKRAGLDTRGGPSTKVVFRLFNATSSTIQYVSSTGSCAMIGETENDKKVFIAANFDKIKDEFAKGAGEYSYSFARMHGCRESGQVQFLKLMKGNYETLHEIESSGDFERLYQYLEAPFKNDPALVSSCVVKA